MAEDAEVVVIGAGISGLTAAALLGAAGLRVCVLEEQPRPGGYLQGFSRQGFRFDTSVHWLGGIGPGGLARRLLDHLGAGWPACRPLRRAWRFRGEAYDYLLTDEPDRLRAALAADFPDEAEGLARLFADCRFLGQRMELMGGRMRAVETMGTWTKARYGLSMLRWYWPLRRFMRADARSGLGRYLHDPTLGGVYAPEERLASVMFPIAWAYARDFHAAPQGGSRAWIEWLVSRIQAQGSTVRLGAPVARILSEAGRASGVELAGGERLRSRWVLAACDVERLYSRMLPEALSPERLRRKLAAADLYYSCVMLFCGLDCSQAELELGEEMIRLTRDGLPTEAYCDGDPDSSALLLLSPTARDPTAAPAGKASLTIQCPAYFEQHARWGTGPGLERGEGYRACKQAFAERLLARVEQQLVPGLRARLAHLSVATPITFWRYTANRAGSIMGVRPTDRNIKNRVAHYRTPLPGLLLAGQWAEFGGGVLMAMRAAANASLLVLEPDHRTAFARLCEVMEADPGPAAGGREEGGAG